MASEPHVSPCHWWPHRSLLQIQILNERKKSISYHISSPGFILCGTQGRKLVPVESFVIPETGSQTSPPANETRNLFPPPPQPPLLKRLGGEHLSIGKTLFQIYKILFFFLSTWQEHQLSLKMLKSSRSLFKRKITSLVKRGCYVLFSILLDILDF